jgi:hypothetical protein
VVVVSWAATAATPVKVRPTVAHAMPNAHEPRAPRPEPMRLSEDSALATTTVPTDSRTAAVRGARRPTTPAPTSSVRPASSSVRVCRRTSTMARRATATAPSSRVLKIANESGLSGLAIGPYMPTSAGLVSSARAASMAS